MTAPRGAYDQFATYFDRYWEHPGFVHWVREIAGRASRLGLPGQRALDVGCGTGRTLEPLLELGFDASGLDISAEMLAIAETKLPAGTPLTCLPVEEMSARRIGCFDLITWLNDGCNHLLDVRQLRRSFSALHSCLSPGGVVAFDANQRLAFSTIFATDHERRSGSLRFRWSGLSDVGISGRKLARARLEAWDEEPTPTLVATWDHLQRFHPHQRIVEELARANLQLVVTHGFDNTGAISDGFAETDLKALYLARKPATDHTERRDHAQDQARQAPRDAGAVLQQDGLVGLTRPCKRPGSDYRSS